MPTYPSDMEPGIGLPGYYLAVSMEKDATLIITRRRRGNPVSPPHHVRLVRLPYPDVTISHLSGVMRAMSTAAKLFGYLSFWALSLPSMLRFQPDIVHVHTPMPILHGLFARYVLRRPFFITFHGTDIHSMARSRLLRALVRKADMVCYVSEHMRTVLEQSVPAERLLYTPSGVDTRAFGPANGDDRRATVLMVGSLRWQKAYPDALTAFARFRRRCADWKLMIVGEGPPLRELREQAGALGLDGAVDFVGMKSREEVAVLMRESSLFVLSSVSEGFPKVILEAAASGTPLVVTDVGSCRQVVDEGLGLVVPPGDPVALASAMETLTTDRSQWRKCSERGPVLVRQFSWPSTAKVLRDTYQKALAN